MSSTEPYPQTPVDESGNNEAQTPRPPTAEWPKKIRTLTATELDRLTIDGAGRFYWDGRLVNYEPPESKAKAEPLDRTPVEAEPGSYDEERKSESAEDSDHDQTSEARSQAVAHRDDPIHDLDDVRATQRMAHHHGAIDGEYSEAMAAPVIQMPDRVRVSLTRWQSLGAILVVLCLLFGSLGVAALGFAAAYEWGCRAGMISQCPAMPGARPAPRPDIPA